VAVSLQRERERRDELVGQRRQEDDLRVPRQALSQFGGLLLGVGDVLLVGRDRRERRVGRQQFAGREFVFDARSRGEPAELPADGREADVVTGVPERGQELWGSPSPLAR
jgi:hypothetical protein